MVRLRISERHAHKISVIICVHEKSGKRSIFTNFRDELITDKAITNGGGGVLEPPPRNVEVKIDVLQDIT